MTKLLGTFLQNIEHFYKLAIKPPQMHFSLKTKQDQAQVNEIDMSQAFDFLNCE